MPLQTSRTRTLCVCVLFPGCQPRLALNLALCYKHPSRFSTSLLHSASSLEITPHRQQETHVYRLSRSFGPERAHRITTSRKAGGSGTRRILLEQSTFRDIGRLIVRMLVDAFDFMANKLFGSSRTLLKRQGHGMRYGPALLAKYPHNQSEGVVCDKGRV